MNLSEAINQLKTVMGEEGVVAEKGLGEELFLFATSLIPIVNIDILLIDKNCRFILAWRDDKYCGNGWHIPGGCIRLQEQINTRIHACAIDEFGTDVDYISDPILIGEGINRTTEIKERSHSISILYICKVNDLSKLKDVDGQHIVGHLKWFDKLPDNLVYVQDFYKDKWLEINNKMEELKNV